MSDKIYLIKPEDVPLSLRDKMVAVTQQGDIFLAEVKQFQENCDHDWQKIMQYDHNYSPMVNRQVVGSNVIKEFRCSICNLVRAFQGLPFDICYHCGGKMKYDRSEQYGMDRVNVHKCSDCGHEYDTT